MIQFLSYEEGSDLKKERLTKDVRYQEFNEVALDLLVWSTGRSRAASRIGRRTQAMRHELRSRVNTSLGSPTIIASSRPAGALFLCCRAVNLSKQSGTHRHEPAADSHDQHHWVVSPTGWCGGWPITAKIPAAEAAGYFH